MLSITHDDKAGTVSARLTSGKKIVIRDPGNPGFFQKLLDLELRTKREVCSRELMQLLSHGVLLEPQMSITQWRQLSKADQNIVATAMSHLKSFRVFNNG